MTLREVMEAVDLCTSNRIEDRVKIKWLSELDMRIYEDIVQRHEGARAYMQQNIDGSFSQRVLPYATDREQLIAPSRFAKMYEAHLRCEIDYFYNEMQRYAEDIAVFQKEYEAFEAWYHETHLPLAKPLITAAPRMKRR